MAVRSGKCLCGATRYSVSGENLWTSLCHCESCRRQTASPVTGFFCVSADTLELNRDQMGTFNSSPGVTRSFCKNCGTPMAFETEERPGEVDLYAATLDDHSEFDGHHHSFWNERVSWLSIDDNLPKKVDYT